MPPIAVWSRLLLYQSTCSAVASSTSARLRRGPRGLISPVLHSPGRALCQRLVTGVAGRADGGADAGPRQRTLETELVTGIAIAEQPPGTAPGSGQTPVTPPCADPDISTARHRRQLGHLP